jgi:hypothetical protein
MFGISDLGATAPSSPDLQLQILAIYRAKHRAVGMGVAINYGFGGTDALEAVRQNTELYPLVSP